LKLILREEYWQNLSMNLPRKNSSPYELSIASLVGKITKGLSSRKITSFRKLKFSVRKISTRRTLCRLQLINPEKKGNPSIPPATLPNTKVIAHYTCIFTVIFTYTVFTLNTGNNLEKYIYMYSVLNISPPWYEIRLWYKHKFSGTDYDFSHAKCPSCYYTTVIICNLLVAHRRAWFVYKTFAATHRLHLITTFMITSIFLIFWDNLSCIPLFSIPTKSFAVRVSTYLKVSVLAGLAFLLHA